MIWFKIVVFFLGILMLVVNFYIESDTFEVFAPEAKFDPLEVKVGGFALVAAMSVFASLLSRSNTTDKGEQTTDEKDNELVLDRAIQAIGAIAAGLGAWFALENAMGSKPWPYFALMGVYVGLIAFGILMVGTISIIRSKMRLLRSKLKSLLLRLTSLIFCWRES